MIMMIIIRIVISYNCNNSRMSVKFCVEFLYSLSDFEPIHSTFLQCSVSQHSCNTNVCGLHSV